MDKLVVPEQFNNLINDLCEIKNIRHIKVCNCTDEIYKEFYEKNIEKEEAYIKENEVSDNIAEMRKTSVQEKTYKDVFEYCKQNSIICEDELKQITQTINVFSDKYDLTDARAYSIVKSIISIQLTSIRLEKESILEGVSLRNSKNEIMINPVEEVKRKYHETLIKSVEVLDKIFEGSKFVLSEDKVVDIKKVLPVLNEEDDAGEFDEV